MSVQELLTVITTLLVLEPQFEKERKKKQQTRNNDIVHAVVAVSFKHVVHRLGLFIRGVCLPSSAHRARGTRPPNHALPNMQWRIS